MSESPAREYKGWEVEVRTTPASDVTGWRVYVMVSANEGAAVRTVPLSFKDGRVFDTEKAARAAGMQLAIAWIDRQ